MLSADDINAKLEQLSIYRRNLRHLLRQAAQHGGEDSAPVNIVNEIYGARDNIRQIKALLRAENVFVDDHPDDFEPTRSHVQTAGQNRTSSSRTNIVNIVYIIFVLGLLVIIVNYIGFGTIKNAFLSSSSTATPSSVGQVETVVATIPTLAPTLTPTTVAEQVQITVVPMTNPSYEKTDKRSIRLIIVRASEGVYPDDYNVYRQGMFKNTPLSMHYFIDKSGNISQFVQDNDIAWHTGSCQWVVDGNPIEGNTGNASSGACNAISLGIELSNLNDGNDPYPTAQYDAAVALIRALVKKYDIPRSQVVQKSDVNKNSSPMRTFPWEKFVDEVYK
jgi:hypothetical protein